jgi:membrane-associated protease RseP (regulator of RpoE activity)
MRVSPGNGSGSEPDPVEILDVEFQPFDVNEVRPFQFRRPRQKFPWVPLLLLFVTFVTTTAIGVEYGTSFAANVEAFSGDDTLTAMMTRPILHPRLLVLGLPFSLTLLAILMAHELGHFFACKYYGIDVSYPYFIPGPPFFGTFGAFLRIRSPITTRRALFDIGIAGPIAGFVLAVPIAAYAISISKVVPTAVADAPILFGTPLVMQAFIGMFHPGTDAASLLLHPIGRAAWVGFLATALNLLPAWQLDGGHIVYSLNSKNHQRISLAVGLSLTGLGCYLRQWPWIVWGFVIVVLSLRFKHPPVYDQWESLNASRKLLALSALVIFVLCFMLWPAISVGG